MTSLPGCPPWCAEHNHDVNLCVGPTISLDFGDTTGDECAVHTVRLGTFSDPDGDVTIGMVVNGRFFHDMTPAVCLAVGQALIAAAGLVQEPSVPARPRLAVLEGGAAR